jgi:hypothetical protein
MRLFRQVTGWASALLIASVLLAQATSQWDQPASALADQIAAILGSGQATLTVRNLSSIADSSIPSIRSLLEKNLKARGIAIGTGESANTVRITLSENNRERLWIAEITEGNQTRVVMVEAGSNTTQSSSVADYMTLRREQLPIANTPNPDARSGDPILAAFDSGNTLVVLHPDTIEVFAFAEGAWQHQKYFGLNETRQLSRDPRGIMIPTADRTAFTAYTGQTECLGAYSPAAATAARPADGWTIRCRASDEPWPVTIPTGTQESAPNMENVRVTPARAFFNAARNYYTGVLSPGTGVDTAPFYSFAEVSRPTGAMGRLLNGIDGKVQIIENGALKPVTGARDWGSDFAVLKSGCGSGAQVIASGSGEAAADSLRAYEIPAQEAIPASAPLAMNGAVTALWPATDGKSLLAAVRQASGDYEVDRVTAQCN